MLGVSRERASKQLATWSEEGFLDQGTAFLSFAAGAPSRASSPAADDRRLVRRPDTGAMPPVAPANCAKDPDDKDKPFVFSRQDRRYTLPVSQSMDAEENDR